MSFKIFSFLFFWRDERERNRDRQRFLFLKKIIGFIFISHCAANFLTSNYMITLERKKTCDFAKVLFDIKISLSCLHYNVIINWKLRSSECINYKNYIYHMHYLLFVGRTSTLPHQVFKRRELKYSYLHVSIFYYT